MRSIERSLLLLLQDSKFCVLLFDIRFLLLLFLVSSCLSGINRFYFNDLKKMLNELYISNFALIDGITINFDKGLNVFTGATGVGKSLIMGALNFLLGSRTTSEVVRSNEKEALVSGVFVIQNASVKERLESTLDITLEDEDVIVQRSIDLAGKNRCKLNNRPITVSVLREVGELLVNISGQYEHESLINPASQLDILDGFGKAGKLKDKFADAYKKAVEKENLLRSLTEDKAARNRQIDLLRFEINEIDDAALGPDELDNLESEHKALLNAEKIQSTISSCYNSLYDTDDSIISRLREVTSDLEKIKDFDKCFADVIEGCSQSVFQLEDSAHSLRGESERFESNPERLSEVEERLETIRRLKSKYGETIDDILNYCSESKEKLDELEKAEEGLENADEDLAMFRGEAFETGLKLTALRKDAGAKLSALIKDELKDLGIADGLFEVSIESIGAADKDGFKLEDATHSGLDKVEFMFSANKGEKVKPLRKIASGGEISRVMLALKRHLAMVDNTPVLVFDEIDSNIGGRMGRVIGEKLKTVAQNHQIVCITHLPQIASYADKHMKVNKSTKGDRTATKIDTLNEKAILEEIAEMIRGEEKTDVTMKQAKEMVEDARKFLKKKTRKK